MPLPVLLVLSLLSQLPSTAEDLPELWKAALRERTGPRGPAVVMNETAPACGSPARFPCMRLPNTARLQPLQPPVPADLFARLTAAASRPPRTVAGVSPPAILVSRGELEDLLESGGGAEAIWRRFYAAHPGSAGFVVFSQPAFDDTGDRALVLMDHSYGSLGGEGRLILLERNRAAGGEAAYWRVATTWRLWIS
jgi:hypothetical protein